MSGEKSNRRGKRSTTQSNGYEASLALLQEICSIFDKPYSKATAERTLVSYDGDFASDWFVKAASNLGFNSKTIDKQPSKVEAINVPFVAIGKDGSASLIVEKNSDSNTCELIDHLGKRSTIDFKTLDKFSSKKVLLITPVQHQSMGVNLSKAKHWLWGPIRTFWSSWAYMVLAAFLVNIIGLAMPLFVMNVYDRVIPYNSISTLWALVIGVGIALLIDFGLRVFRSLLISNTSRRIDMGVSANLFEQAMDMKMSARKAKTGELSSHIREFDSVRDFFTSSGLISFIDLMFIGIFLFVLWLIVGPLALVPLVALPVILCAALLMQVPLAASVKKSQTAQTHRQTILVESLANIETVKAVSAEGVLQKRWESAVANSVRASSSIGFWSSLATFVTLFAQQGVSVLIITWGVFLVAAGDITIGALIASNILAGRVLAPIGGIANTLVRFQQSLTAFGFLDNLMNLERDHGSGNPSSATINKARLELRDVTFAYPDHSHNALEKMGATISPGERVAILGRVGSGKSTLGKLLCGLYPVTDGAIILDNTDIDHYAKTELRNAVGYVSQEPELFSGTLRENILLTNSDPDRFEHACAISGVAAIAQSHPLGFEMQVGERGKDLSGGQRQAVALARALMSDHKILFLDEPTGQMDTASEAAFLNGFANWFANDKTLIISTHRNAVLSIVSRIIVLENGKIVADGPRDKVLAKLQSSGVVKREGGS